MKRYDFFALTVALMMSLNLAVARPLDIYFIDMEGGAATLIVTPAGDFFDSCYTLLDHNLSF